VASVRAAGVGRIRVVAGFQFWRRCDRSHAWAWSVVAACWAWAAGKGNVDKSAPTSVAAAMVVPAPILKMGIALLAW
jgi:hypothetical protein